LLNVAESTGHIPFYGGVIFGYLSFYGLGIGPRLFNQEGYNGIISRVMPILWQLRCFALYDAEAIRFK